MPYIGKKPADIIATAVDTTTGTFSGAVSAASVDADGGVTVDNITIDGTEIDLSSGDLTIDVAGDITLDAGGGDVNFQDDGTLYGFMAKSSDNLLVGNAISDGDVTIRGNDGGSNISAVTFDMSEAGAATFNSSVTMSTSMTGQADDGQFEFISKDTSGSGSTDYGDFIFKGRRGADNDTVTMMNMDGATGSITKPNNPSFRAMGSNAAYQTTSPVPFPSVSGTNLGGHNTGSHYNTSNYRFTAPVAGKYLFHVHMGIINIGANGGNGYPYLRINATSVAYSFVQMPASASYAPAHVTQIFNLAANDYVDVTFGGSNATYYGNYTELSFSGCLLG